MFLKSTLFLRYLLLLSVYSSLLFILYKVRYLVFSNTSSTIFTGILIISSLIICYKYIVMHLYRDKDENFEDC